MEKTPGQVAFEKWASLITPPITQEWAALPETAQGGWKEVAAAAIAQHIGNSEMADLIAEKIIIGNNTGELRGIVNANTNKEAGLGWTTITPDFPPDE
jgi:hypothetical protein